MPDSTPPALKEWFNIARFQQLAKKTAIVYPDFDARHFLTLSLPGLDELTLLQRLRRATESLHATLPSNYLKALAVLRLLAPTIHHKFVAMFLADFVGLYGQEHVKESMEALRFFTLFGSSEFGVRPFLRNDLQRTLEVMEGWTGDQDEHVRRLASEGCRPRLPWSFRLPPLIADPSPVRTILENLKADSSLYVRKSVANHLNDITKDHPKWVLDLVEGWDLGNMHTAWIVKRALRTLIKEGNASALAVVGAGRTANIQIEKFSVSPKSISLGEYLVLALKFFSLSKLPQKLIIDYRVDYVKKSGSTSAKIFKWKELILEPKKPMEIMKRQAIRDFTTRKHHAGAHKISVMMNGKVLSKASFHLSL